MLVINYTAPFGLVVGLWYIRGGGWSCLVLTVCGIVGCGNLFVYLCGMWYACGMWYISIMAGCISRVEINCVMTLRVTCVICL